MRVLGVDVARGVHDLTHDVEAVSVDALVVFLVVSNLCFVGVRVALTAVSRWLSPTYRSLEARVRAGGDTDAQQLLIAWNNRMVGTVHACLSAGSGLAACLVTDPRRLYTEPEEVWYGSKPAQLIAIWLTSSFMLHDGLAMLWRIGLHLPSIPDCMMLLHHAIVAFIFTSAALKKPRACALLLMCAYQIFEASTPFLHFRWLLIKTGRFGTLTYKINGVIFVVTFFLLRIVFNAVIVHFTVFLLPAAMIEEVPVERALSWLFSGLQVYWFIEIITIAFNPRRDQKKDN